MKVSTRFALVAAAVLLSAGGCDCSRHYRCDVDPTASECADGGEAPFSNGGGEAAPGGGTDSAGGSAQGGGEAGGQGGGVAEYPAAPAAAGVTTEEIVGYWNNPTWGDMVLKVVGAEIWGTYSHDEGTLVLRWREDGTLWGWWSEVPSRLPSNDAGDAEFVFKKDGTVISFDGRWRYGVEGTWRQDWDLTRRTTAPPQVLVDRFNDPTLFKRHPSLTGM